MSDPNANRPGYRETKVGWIPEEWSVAPVGKLTKFVTSGPRGWADYYSETGALFIRSQNVRDGRLDFSDRQHVSPPSGAEGTRTRVALNDLLITITGNGVGNVALVEQDFCDAYISQHVGLVRLQDSSTGRFVFQFLSPGSPGNRQIWGSQSGQSKPGLTLRNLKEFVIALPSNSEQQRIAEVISTAEDTIEKTAALIEAKKRRKKALMQQLLSGKKRLPGFKGMWRKQRLSDLFERVSRKNKTGCDNILSISGALGLVKQEDYFNKRIAPRDVSGYYHLKRGEFAYNKSYCKGYPLGAIKMLDRYDEGVVSTLYICFRLKADAMITAFIVHYFESGEFNQELYAIAHEGARNHGLLNVSTEDFFNTHISVPTQDEQSAIAEVLDNSTRELERLEDKLATLQQQKKALMQKLLTGQVRVKVD